MEHGGEHEEHEDAKELTDEVTGYQPPNPKSLDEILMSDADDESLRKYKETLLGVAEPVKIDLCRHSC